MEIVPYKSGLALIITGAPPHPLKEIGADHYRLDGMPETFQVRVKRADGGVAALLYEQPNMRLELASRQRPKPAPTIVKRGPSSTRRLRRWAARQPWTGSRPPR